MGGVPVAEHFGGGGSSERSGTAAERPNAYWRILYQTLLQMREQDSSEANLTQKLHVGIEPR